MPRTLYRDRDTLDTSALNMKMLDRVTIYFPKDSPKATVPSSRFITVPVGSTWSTGLHWHEEYIERVRVVKGRAKVTIGNVTKVYGPRDGVLTFPKFVIHGFGRADGGRVSDVGSGDDPEDLELEEWVDPENGFKAVFFYNVFSVLLDTRGSLGVSDLIQLATTVSYMDEYPVIIPGPFVVKSLAIHGLLKLSSWIGWVLGYKPCLEEYTPKHLWEVALTRGKSASKARTE